jgi:hypothetical protein
MTQKTLNCDDDKANALERWLPPPSLSKMRQVEDVVRRLFVESRSRVRGACRKDAGEERGM